MVFKFPAKNNPFFLFLLSLVFIFNVFHVSPAFSDDKSGEIPKITDEIDEELRYLKAETYVITASRVMEEIKKAPALITVVTDKQIRQMGARDVLDAVARAVPNVRFYTFKENVQLINVRGEIKANGVLYMINGHPINRAIFGDYHYSYGDLIIDNIQRIEFIRGPGSALYGAYAFQGVLNVITKEAEDIDGVSLTATGGSWDTQQYNLLYGKKFGDLKVACNFNYFKTHGFRRLIKEDKMTLLDQIWYIPYGLPPISLAPGRTNGDEEKYDLALNLKFKGFTFDGKYIDKEWDSPTNKWAVLVNKSKNSPRDYSLTLAYETSFWKGLDLYGKVYRNEDETSEGGQWYPPGFTAMTPTGLAIWPNGPMLFEEYGSKRTGIEIQATYKMGDTNTVVAGAIYEHQEAYVSISADWLHVPVFVQLPSVQQWPDDLTMGKKTGNFKAVFLEDIWDITGDLRLTAGLRYDHYSSFEGHVSPRIGLTWEYVKGYDLKLLYGHAFRAPTFLELYNPSGGNPDLDPEIIDTYEISFGAEFPPFLNGRVTFYHIETKDIILHRVIPPYNWENRGSSRKQGVELEVKYDFGRGTYLGGNYNYLDQKTGRKEEWSRGKIMTNIRLSRYLNFYADYSFLYGFHDRLPGDTKGDYTNNEIVNATLIAKKFMKGYEKLELRVSAYNLLDEDYAQYTYPEIPFDLPLPDRNFLFEMKYTF